MFILPNGKHIDKDMVELAMEASNLANAYYLNTRTGEVVCLSDFDDGSDERENSWKKSRTVKSFYDCLSLICLILPYFPYADPSL
jgi:hypothetical protein